MLFACAFALLAGVDGIGPSHNGVKVRCLTTWLIPIDGTSMLPIISQEDYGGG